MMYDILKPFLNKYEIFLPTVNYNISNMDSNNHKAYINRNYLELSSILYTDIYELDSSFHIRLQDKKLTTVIESKIQPVFDYITSHFNDINLYDVFDKNLFQSMYEYIQQYQSLIFYQVINDYIIVIQKNNYNELIETFALNSDMNVISLKYLPPIYKKRIQQIMNSFEAAYMIHII